MPSEKQEILAMRSCRPDRKGAGSLSVAQLQRLKQAILDKITKRELKSRFGVSWEYINQLEREMGIETRSMPRRERATA